MDTLHPLAISLNNELAIAGGTISALLSRRGRAAYFPSKGILGQSNEAKDAAINATIGTAFEEDGSPLCLECLEEALSLPSSTFLYAPSFGVPALRERWREMLLSKNPSLRGRSFGLPVVTHALTHALSVVGHLFVDEGDTIIIPDLFWDNYELIFAQAYGAGFETFPTFSGNGFNIEGLARLLDAPGCRKRLLLNFPNNPSGYTVTDSEARAIRDILLRCAERGCKLLVVLDDAYFGLVYEEGVYGESLFAELAELHENLLAVKLDGPTKEDYVWGFRVGFVTYGCKGLGKAQYAALEAKTAGVVRGSVSNVSNIAQHLLLNAYAHPDYDRQKASKLATLRSRYNRICEILKKHPEYAGAFTPMPFNSGYFMCVKPVGADPEAVRRRLLEAFDTGVIVCSGLIRLAFSAVPVDRLETLFANVYNAVNEVRRQGSQ